MEGVNSGLNNDDDAISAMTAMTAMTVMPTVTSVSNQWVKLCKEVAGSNRARLDHRLVFIEGVHLCDTYLNSSDSSKKQETVQAGLLLIGESHQANAEIAALRSLWAGRVLVLADKVFHTISQVQNGPAVAMLVGLPDTGLPASCVTDMVYLDGLQDPGNAGTIIRTAVACGICTLCASPGTVSLWSPKVLRSAMGAHFHISIVEGVSIGDVMVASKAGGARVRAMAGAAPKSIFAADLRGATVWALGNEGQGLDLSLYAAIDPQGQAIESTVELLCIPQQGVESLNVAVAASVCFYEQWRQRHSQ